jgi:hypothetical protein
MTQTKNASSQDILTKKTSLEKPDKASLKRIGFYTLNGDSVVVPPFEIEIALSPKAKERIVNSNETIIVDISLEGIPKDSSNAHFEEDGSFYVGSFKKEISYGQIARFDNLKFSRKIYDQLADKDVDLSVNVYSGRKSSSNNLLNVDFLSDKVSNIINRHFTLKGKLIYGDN